MTNETECQNECLDVGITQRAPVESEAFYRAVFDATPDPMILSDEQGFITMANQQAARILGYEEDELVGQPIEILVPERFRENHKIQREHFSAEQKVRPMDSGMSVPALRKDGSELAVEVSLSPIQTKQGLFFASAMRDVTLRKLAEEALRASEERFRLVANASPAMIWITDAAGNPSFVNRAWLDFTGIEFSQAMTHEGWANLIHPEDRENVLSAYYKNTYDHGPILTEYRLRRSDGDWRWILDKGVPIYNESEKFSGYAGSAIDISERKQTEAEFRIAATAFESQEAMVITDTNTTILRVNKAFIESTGYTADELIGQKISLLKSGRHDAVFYAEMWKTLHHTGSWKGEIWDKRKNGEIYPKWLSITAVKDAEGVVTHYVGTHIDISKRKAAEEEIMNLAFYDPLTRLPNRRLLRDRLLKALPASARSGMYGALLFIDLDNFKTLNDTHGHDVGDLLLQQVASRLTISVRETDTVARLGGDEFVVMLENLNGNAHEAASQVKVIGEKIIAMLNQPYQLMQHDFRSTPSIGVTLFCECDKSIDELLKQADIAMYQAKTAGRNTLRFFDPTMQAVVTARANLEADLHQAIEQKQFLLYYQAQVNGKGCLTGAEVLVRWRHPNRGIIYPAEFIPLAEETGLIVPLGQWILETACAQLVAWAEKSGMAHLTIAVNVSVRQFRQTDFVDQVLRALVQSGANPRKLKLELTESLLVSNIDDIIDKMNTLKQKGLAFSLDDFGTGYSSLSYLKRLPLDQLKIDQGFIRDVLVDRNDAAIAKMVVALAESMGLEVIAEGVESKEQKEFLADNGCHAYQGYLFSRPLSLEAFEDFVKQA